MECLKRQKKVICHRIFLTYEIAPIFEKITNLLHIFTMKKALIIFFFIGFYGWALELDLP